MMISTRGRYASAGYAGSGSADHRQVCTPERNSEPPGDFGKYLEIVIKVLVQNKLLTGLWEKAAVTA